MTTDVLTETVVDEVEAIVRAEWMRLHYDSPREQLRSAVSSGMPAAKPRPVRGATLTATLTRSQPLPQSRRTGWPPRGAPQRRVWPTQRSPPRPRGVPSHSAEQRR